MQNKYVLKLRVDADPNNWKIISKKITYDKLNEEKSKAKYKLAYDEAQRKYEKELAEYPAKLAQREEYDRKYAEYKKNNDNLSWWNPFGFRIAPEYVRIVRKPRDPWASKFENQVHDTITETLWTYYNVNETTKAEAFETLNEYTGFRSRKEAEEKLDLAISECIVKAWLYRDYKN